MVIGPHPAEASSPTLVELDLETETTEALTTTRDGPRGAINYEVEAREA